MFPLTALYNHPPKKQTADELRNENIRGTGVVSHAGSQVYMYIIPVYPF
jgi:hypothetical protein